VLFRSVVATCFLVLGWRIYPRTGAAWRAYRVTLGFVVIPAVADILTGGNYMYMRAKPEHNSLLSLMGPWPWYIGETAAVAAVMFLVLQLLADWLRRRDLGLPRSRIASPGEASAR
jgi:uncharacterized membrane protein YwaF